MYRHKFSLPSSADADSSGATSKGGGAQYGVAEFHPDKIVLRRFKGRVRSEFTFHKLWAIHAGKML